MAEEALNTIFDSIKTEAQNQSPPITPVTSPNVQSSSESPELTNILGGVRERAAGIPPKPEAGTPQLTEDAIMQSMQEKRSAHAEGRDTIAYVNSNIVDRTLSAFGHGLATGINDLFFNSGDAPLPKSIKDILPINGEHEWLNSINRAVLRPIAGLFNNLDTIALKAFAPVSIPFGAATEAAGTIPSLKPLADTLNDPAMMMILHQSINPHQFVTKPPLQPEIYRAVDNGIITPTDPAIKTEAAAAQKAAYMEKQRGLVNPTQGPSIHEIARAEQPELFDEKTRLETRQQVLRDSFNNPDETFGKEYDEKLSVLKEQQAQSTRVPVGLEGDELQKAVDEGNRKGTEIDQQIRDLGNREDYVKDAADKAREEHTNNLHRLAEISTNPRVKAAYQEAQRKLREGEPPVTEQPVTEAPKVAEPLPAPSGRTQEQQHQAIVDEIVKKAAAAGYALDEARAGAEILARQYRYLSEVYGGAKGSAEELYAREAPEITNEKPNRVTKIIRKVTGKKELAQVAKGAYAEATNEERGVIHLLKTADASTLVHEGAHHFLNMLKRYEAMGEVPDALKADMATIRQWLKVKEDGVFTTKMEEKFARGWETYLREGHAPTKELMSIFQKFAKWMRDIYDAAGKSIPYGKISPKVKEFFDRVLEPNAELRNNPHGGIIAPEHEPAAAIAAIHESDAKTTPPAQADVVRDNIAKEVDSVAKLHDQEVADGIKNAEQTTGIAAPPASSTTNAAAGQSAREGGAAQEPESFTTGGGAVRTEGVPARAKPAAERGGTSVPPATTGESPIIGKDGKIDTSAAEKIGHQEWLKRYNAELLRREQDGTAEKLFSFEDTVKLSDLRNIAEQMNMTVEQLKNIPTDYGTLTERPILRAGAYILMKQLHEEMISSAKDAIASGKAENMAEFIKTYDKRDQLLNAYKTTEMLSKEAGVHLVASKIIEAIDVTGVKETGAILYQMEQMEREGKASKNGLTQEDVTKMTELANMIGKSDNSAEVANILDKVNKPTFWDKLREAQVVLLTSGLVTHASYFLGGLPLNLFKSGIEDTLTAVVDKLRGKAGFETAGDRLTQGLRGISDQIARLPNTLSATGTAVTEGKTVLLPRENFTTKNDLFNNIRKTTAVDPEVVKKAVNDNFSVDKFSDLVELQDKANDAMKKGDAAVYGRLQSKLDVEIARKKAILEKHFTAEIQSRLKTWSDIYSASKDWMLSQASGLRQMIKDERSGSETNPIYSALKFETQAIYGGIHTFQRFSLMAGEFRAECRRNVLAEAEKNKEDLSEKEIDLRTDNLMIKPTQPVMDNVIKTANELSFMNSNSAYVRKLNGLLSVLTPWNIPLGKIIAPITTVPTNIAAELLKRTPIIGTALKDVRDDMSGKNGITAQNKAIARQLSGLGVIVTGYILAQNKMATPSSSINHQHDQQKIEAGEQPGSIKVGDSWADISTIPVLSNLLTLGADLHYIRNIAIGDDESETLRAAAFSAARNFALHENALVNLSDAMDAVTGKSSLENYLKNLASSVTAPALISQLNQDPYQRDAKTVLDKLKSKVQETSETLQPKISPITGEILQKKESIIPGTRFYQAPTIADPIAAKLTALHLYPTNPKPQINGVDLSPQQGTEFSVVKAHILNSGMRMLMQGDGAGDFNAANNVDKRKMAIKIETYATQCAKSYMFNKYPELLKDANDKYEASCRGEDFNYSPEASVGN